MAGLAGLAVGGAVHGSAEAPAHGTRGTGRRRSRIHGTSHGAMSRITPSTRIACAGSTNVG